MTELTIMTLAELEAEADRFAGRLIPKEQGATLVTLSGELGAGKTAFTQAVARVLGVKSVVTSPTFVLEKGYPLVHTSFTKLVHIDAYRLESGAGLAPLNFDELMHDAGTLIMLEWPERVADALPAPTIRMYLIVNPDGSRTISYE